jgi:hypothetical protein
LIGVALLAVMVQVRPGTGNAWRIIDFSLGFIAWYAVAILVWALLRISHQESYGLLFINPWAILVPVVHLVLMIFLFAKERQMARGAVAAMVVNSVGMLFLIPIGVAWVSTSLFAAAFMMPFFMLL